MLIPLKRVLTTAVIVLAMLTISQAAEQKSSETQQLAMTVVFPAPSVPKLDFRPLAEKAAYYCGYSCNGLKTQIPCAGDSGSCDCFCANGSTPVCRCKPNN